MREITSILKAKHKNVNRQSIRVQAEHRGELATLIMLSWQWRESSSEFLSHFPTRVYHWVMIVVIIWHTIIVSLILLLQPRDAQGGRIGGAVNWPRKPLWNPRGSFIVIIDNIYRGVPGVLLVPVHRVWPNVSTAAGTRDGDFLPQRSWHRGALSQYKLGPRLWKKKLEINEKGFPIPWEKGDIMINSYPFPCPKKSPQGQALPVQLARKMRKNRVQAILKIFPTLCVEGSTATLCPQVLSIQPPNPKVEVFMQIFPFQEALQAPPLNLTLVEKRETILGEGSLPNRAGCLQQGLGKSHSWTVGDQNQVFSSYSTALWWTVKVCHS